MYKAQFAKWNWHKYITGSQVSITNRCPTRRGRKGTARLMHAQSMNREQNAAAQVQSQLLEPDESRYLGTAMLAIRSFILGWSEKDSRWREATPFTRMGQYNPAMISQFVTALLQLQQRDFQQGGRLLRTAFLELEELVADGHIAAVWDCCIAVPLLTMNHHRPDILRTFLRYLTQLCASRAPTHPLRHICPALLAFASPPTPRCIAAYTTAAWRLWSDTMASRLGRSSNINLLHNQRSYLVIQQNPDPSLIRQMVQEFDSLVEEATDTFGPDTTTTLTLEFDNLLTQTRFNTVHPSALESRLVSVLQRLSNKPGNAGNPPQDWSLEDRQVYRGSWFLATLYAEKSSDVEKATRCRETFLAAPHDGDWVQYAARLEERLKLAGKIAEAEQVRARREEVQIPRRVVEILEEEERGL